MPGFRFAGVAAGIKPSGRPDVALMVADTPACSGPTMGCPASLTECGGPKMTQNYLDYTDDEIAGADGRPEYAAGWHDADGDPQNTE